MAYQEQNQNQNQNNLASTELFTSSSGSFPSSTVLSGVLSHFPPCEFSFAYGSGVFKQLEGDKQQDEQTNASAEEHSTRPTRSPSAATASAPPLVDLIFAVSDPVVWHSQNLARNSSHYSFLRHFGSEFVSSVQRSRAGLYFNPLITVSQIPIKYGVIAYSDLLTDLRQWNFLYAAGRLHKPVKFIQKPSMELAEAMQKNLEFALSAALLLVPPHSPLSLSGLFRSIASLSYAGDIRMKFAENPNKIQNLVGGNFEKFRQLYDDKINQLQNCNNNGSGSSIRRLISVNESGLIQPPITADSRAYLFGQLPASIKAVVSPVDSKLNLSAADYSSRFVSLPIPMQQSLLSSALSSRVFSSSLAQTSKGLFTAGIHRSLVYATRKILKAFK